MEVLSTIFFNGDNAVLFKAYNAAQKNMGDVLKTATNPAFRSKYADLSAVVEAVIPAFLDAGFMVFQNPTYEKELQIVHIDLLLGHESGGFIQARLSIPVSKHDAQGVGSAVTYGRRYQLLAISGAAPEDDDGNGASEKPKPQPKQAQVATKSSAKPSEEPPFNIIEEDMIFDTISDAFEWFSINHKNFANASNKTDVERTFTVMFDKVVALYANIESLTGDYNAFRNIVSEQPMYAAVKPNIVKIISNKYNELKGN